MCLQILNDHNDIFSSVVFSHDSTRLATASHKIVIWDVNSGECLQMLEGHRNNLTSVAFSYDSTQLASASRDNTVKIWNIGREAYLDMSDCHGDGVQSVAFSHDCILLASASRDKIVEIWDTSSGACLHTLEGHSDWAISVTFSRDSAWLAPASFDRTVRIWDTSSNACLWTLEFGTCFQRISFDDDNSRLHTDTGTIRIGASSIVRTACSIRQTPQYSGLGLSPDGTWITYSSDNFLWLPSDYRPGLFCSAVSGNFIAMGNANGKVRIFKFSSNHFKRG